MVVSWREAHARRTDRTHPSGDHLRARARGADARAARTGDAGDAGLTQGTRSTAGLSTAVPT